MQMDIKNISYDQLEIFAEILNQCTENFVFIFDVKNKYLNLFILFFIFLMI